MLPDEELKQETNDNSRKDTQFGRRRRKGVAPAGNETKEANKPTSDNANANQAKPRPVPQEKRPETQAPPRPRPSENRTSQDKPNPRPRPYQDRRFSGPNKTGRDGDQRRHYTHSSAPSAHSGVAAKTEAPRVEKIQWQKKNELSWVKINTILLVLILIIVIVQFFIK